MDRGLWNFGRDRQLDTFVTAAHGHAVEQLRLATRTLSFFHLLQLDASTAACLQQLDRSLEM
jgi:hypothetical protein